MDFPLQTVECRAIPKLMFAARTKVSAGEARIIREVKSGCAWDAIVDHVPVYLAVSVANLEVPKRREDDE